MEKIFKYKLTFKDTAEVEMPLGAKILTADKQAGSMENPTFDHYVCIWAIVDTEVTEMEIRRFKILGTGSSTDDLHLKYINTIQIYDGAEIYHIFEVLQ